MITKEIKKIIPDNIKKALLRLIYRERKINLSGTHSLSECICCGSSSIVAAPILWEKLIQDWQLSEYETDYINRQQGVYCQRCKVNLRGMAIAYGMMRDASFRGYFKDFVRTRKVRSRKILEINEAAWLTQYFNMVSGHVLGSFPEVDMQMLPYENDSFDIVVHSDTLEHVPDPLIGLRECYRVLALGGYCVFTVPMVIDRLTRSRVGLPPSFHGSESKRTDDYIVHTEFGGDAWKLAVEAGFSEVRVYSLEYPAALCFLCVKEKNNA